MRSGGGDADAAKYRDIVMQEVLSAGAAVTWDDIAGACFCDVRPSWIRSTPSRKGGGCAAVTLDDIMSARVLRACALAGLGVPLAAVVV
eukprot:344703-Chlamydomonas_euryale.AAC.1